MLEKAEAWALKYQHAHPIWFGGFSAVLVINDPEYAKALFARGGKRQWFSCGAAAPDCNFPKLGWQFSARQVVTNRLYYRNQRWVVLQRELAAMYSRHAAAWPTEGCKGPGVLKIY